MLHVATLGGSTSLIERFINAGIDVNVVDIVSTLVHCIVMR